MATNPDTEASPARRPRITIPEELARLIADSAEEDGTTPVELLSACIRMYRDRAKIPFQVEAASLLREVAALESLVALMVDSNLELSEAILSLEGAALKVLVSQARFLEPAAPDSSAGPR